MKLREEILKEHSKQQCAAIVAWVGKSQKRFDELFGLFINDEYRVVQRAAWPVSYCVQAYPALIHKHFDKLVKKLQEPGIHDAVKRNSIRLLQYVNIPEEWQGDIMNLCFGYISIPGQAIATRAFSITVLANMAKQYPEIIPELKMIIEEQQDNESPGLKSRSKKILKALQKNQ
jgi:hypothetical protein